MQRLILLALLSSLVAPVVARAESPTQLLCAPAEREWAKVKDGTDVAAMDRTIREIGPHCAAVIGANMRRAVVEAGLKRKALLSRNAPPPGGGSASATQSPHEQMALYDDGARAYQAGDYKRAMGFWLRMKGNTGDLGPMAQNYIGLMYQNGLGVPLDYGQAMAWYQKAADAGLAVAEYNIGSLYDLGLGVAQDHNQAATWYEKAAGQGIGYPPAQYHLGLLYYYGLGVTQDASAGRSLIRRAAETGDADAKKWLSYNGG